MKFIHLSDLHIGKRVNEFSMLEDQEYILKEILRIVDEEKPKAVFICGDVYDKSVPSAEAVSLFDDFLVRLAKRQLSIFIISGNHDSPERIAFGAKLMQASDVFLSPVYRGEVEPVTMCDEHGEIYIYMLPFIKPVHVRAIYPDETIDSYNDAVQVAINHLQVDKTKRNILLTHQFITGSRRSESEDISVGGSDNIAASVFDDFDYVALGHIHEPQSVGRETLRYCGTPLKYSFSEAKHEKSVTVVEMAEKGKVAIRTVALIPKRDMVEIKGLYNDIMSKTYYDALDVEDYFHITLTNEEEEPDALNKLRVIYKNIMKLDYDNKRTRSGADFIEADNRKALSPLEIMAEFYETQNNQPLSETQEILLNDLIEKIWSKS